MKMFSGLLVGVFLFVVPSALVQGQVQTSASKVKITAESAKPDADGKQLITLNLTIEKGWHIYANPVKHNDFLNCQTVVRLKAGAPVKASIDYPPGKFISVEMLGSFNIYEDQVVIKVQVVRTPGDISPLEVSVDVQAKSSGSCLVPGTVKLTLK